MKTRLSVSVPMTPAELDLLSKYVRERDLHMGGFAHTVMFAEVNKTEPSELFYAPAVDDPSPRPPTNTYLTVGVPMTPAELVTLKKYVRGNNLSMGRFARAVMLAEVNKATD